MHIKPGQLSGIIMGLAVIFCAGVAGAAKAQVSTFGDGSYIVGSDIQPGIYRSLNPSGDCYWERESGFSGELQDILANDNPAGPAVVSIGPTDRGFKSEDCGTWTADLSPITSSLTAPFGDGTYIVGTDIAAGTWRATGGSDCYWERLGGFGGTLRDTIANDFAGASIVTISTMDRGFKSDGCGTWTKVS
ncbi:MAG: hypothetical protein ACR2PL_22120 [Dehalococcoidia bacterium]